MSKQKAGPRGPAVTDEELVVRSVYGFFTGAKNEIVRSLRGSNRWT